MRKINAILIIVFSALSTTSLIAEVSTESVATLTIKLTVNSLCFINFLGKDYGSTATWKLTPEITSLSGKASYKEINKTLQIAAVSNFPNYTNKGSEEDKIQYFRDHIKFNSGNVNSPQFLSDVNATYTGSLKQSEGNMTIPYEVKWSNSEIDPTNTEGLMGALAIRIKSDDMNKADNGDYSDDLSLTLNCD